MSQQNTATRRVRTNLLQRKQGWYARYFVPKHQQPLLGRREVVRTLGTRDKLEAHRRLPAALAEIQREVDGQPQRTGRIDYRNAELVVRELERHEDTIRRDRTIDPDLISTWVENTVDRHFDQFPDEDRCPETGIPETVDSKVLETARRVNRVAYDPDYRSLSEWLEEHLTSMQLNGLVASTRSKRARAIATLIDVFGPRRDPRTFRPEDVVRFGDHLRTQSSTVRTKKDVATNVHTFFEWLRKHRRIIVTNPFHGLSDQIEGSRNDGSLNRRAWHPEELEIVLRGLNAKGRLWAIAVLSLYSGMRITEICSLEVVNVSKRGMQITKENAKNDNSVRMVPIHPMVAPLVERLVSTSYDGFLISGLKLAGQDKRRGAYPSKRFSELRKSLGLTDPETTFHSFRHNFITAAERCGVVRPTVEKIVGHARQGITLSRYSDGPEERQLIEAVAKVSFNRPAFDDLEDVLIDPLVASVIVGHEGNAGWRRGYLRDLVREP